MAPEPLVRVRNLSKALAGTPVLHGISFELSRGEFLGLIGANGAGKTTLLRCLTGQWTVPEGTVWIGGRDITADPLTARQALGWAYEVEDLLDRLTGAQHLDFVAGIRAADGAAAQIREIGDMLDMTSVLPDEVGTYSHGMRQKLGIMMALVGSPPLIVMDESLNGLDPLVSYRLKCHLRDLAAGGRSAVLLASHMLESLERYCTGIVMMRGGRLCRTWSQEEIAAEAAGGRHLEDLFVELMNADVSDVAGNVVNQSTGETG